ncbi:MAG TPA: DUF4070 domain-containing protein [Methyloceanibacter sp.]|nr:DUF4070 domain-containing protein [Methyloceanibacter sp.]
MGRLNDEEASDKYGTNVIPLGMSREQLCDGSVRVMQTCYKADAYFRRLDAQFIEGNFKFTLHQLPYWGNHRWAWLKRCFFNYIKFAVIASRVLRLQANETLASRYSQQLLRVTRARWREPHILFIYALKVATHYHYAAITRALSEAEGERGTMPNAGVPFRA